MLRRLRNWLVGGFVALAPLALTYYIFVWIFNLLDSAIKPLLKGFEWADIPGIGAAITLGIILAVGALASNLFGKAILGLIDRLALRMPIVRPVYQTIRQIMDTVSSQTMAFNQVALVEYPRRDSWVIGFVTGGGAGEITRRTGKKLLNVFVPTTPNPTSGMLILVPEEDVILLDMSVDQGLKLVISGGILSEPAARETAAAGAGSGGGSEPSGASGSGGGSESSGGSGSVSGGDA